MGMAFPMPWWLRSWWYVLRDDVAQVPLAQGDDVAQTLLANGPDEALRIGVEVRGTGGKANELDARGGDGALELRGVQRVAVDDGRAPLRKPEVALLVSER
jgi:hypothetical protein